MYSGSFLANVANSSLFSNASLSIVKHSGSITENISAVLIFIFKFFFKAVHWLVGYSGVYHGVN